jgi:periplasmic copper chaperone A
MSPAGSQTRMTRPLQRFGIVAAFALVLFAVSASALAHVEITTEDELHPLTVATISFEFDHGCDGQPTTELAVRVPDEVLEYGIWPTESDGWTAYVEDGVMIWTGGEPIPDHQHHAFQAELSVPNLPGETLYLPTIQRCGDTEVHWIQRPGEDEEDGDRPAPSITVSDQPAPDQPGIVDLEDEEPPPPPEEDDDEPIMEPVASPVADVDEPTNWWPLVVALTVGVLAGLPATAWRRARRQA